MVTMTDTETRAIIEYLETKPYKEVEILILMLKKKMYDNKDIDKADTSKSMAKAVKEGR